jgi:hypothetical protein
LAFLAFATAGFAQDRTGAEEVVNDALITLRAHGHVFFQLKGSETLNGQTFLFSYNVSFQVNVDSSGTVTGAYIDVEAYRDGIFNHRLCGDGVTLWKYLPARRAYQPVRYGVENGPQPAGYLDSLIRKFDSVSDQYETRIATLLRQTYASTGTNYESWFPGVQPVSAGSSVVYLGGNPPSQGLTFTLTTDVNGNIGLGAVDLFDKGLNSPVPRPYTWHMSVTKDLSYLPGTFVFRPPAGSLPIKG